MLNALVLPDRTVEHDALVRILGSTRQRRAAQPNRFGRDQNALRIQAVQDVRKALVFLTHPVFHGDAQTVDEHLIGIHAFAPQLVDLANLHRAAIHIGIEQTQAFRALAFLHRLGAREQQDLVGHLGRRNPHLLPRHDVVIAMALGTRLQLQGVEPRVRLGHTKTGLVGPRDERRQPALFLLLRSKHHHRVQAKDIHVHRRSARQPRAGCRDGVHHQRGLADTQPRPTELLRHRNAQPTSIRQRLVKVMRKAPLAVLHQPVIGIKGRAHTFDGIANLLLLFVPEEVHGFVSF